MIPRRIPILFVTITLMACTPTGRDLDLAKMDILAEGAIAPDAVRLFGVRLGMSHSTALKVLGVHHTLVDDEAEGSSNMLYIYLTAAAAKTENNAATVHVENGSVTRLTVFGMLPRTRPPRSAFETIALGKTRELLLGCNREKVRRAILGPAERSGKGSAMPPEEEVTYWYAGGRILLGHSYREFKSPSPWTSEKCRLSISLNPLS